MDDNREGITIEGAAVEAVLQLAVTLSPGPAAGAALLTATLLEFNRRFAARAVSLDDIANEVASQIRSSVLIRHDGVVN